MKKKLLLSLIILLILLGTFAGSVSLFSYAKVGSKESSIQIGELTFKYTETSGKGQGINLDDAYPMSDTEGKALTEYFDFKVEANLTRSDLAYTVELDTTLSDLPDDGIKLYLTEIKDGNEVEINSIVNTISSYQTNDNGRIIYSETIPRNTKNYVKNFRLRLWIDESIDWTDDLYMGHSGTFKVNVKANSNSSMAATDTVTDKTTSIERVVANNMYLFTTSSDTGVDYEVTVPYTVDNVDIEVYESNTQATSTVTPINSLSGVSSKITNQNIHTGNNYFKVITTASNGTNTDEYVVKVVKEANPDNNLLNLGVEGYSLTPTFDHETTSYTLTLEEPTITITGQKSASEASINLNDLGEKNLVLGENTFTITVTSESGVDKTYTIVITNSRPIAPTITGGDSDWVTSRTISLADNNTAFAISGIDHYEVYDTNISTVPTEDTVATSTTSGNYIVDTNSTHYIYYRTVSNKGYKSEWSNPQVVNIDTTTPSTVAFSASDSKASNAWHTANYILTISATKNGGSDLVYYYGTTNNPTTEGSSFTTNGNTAGTTYYAKACTAVGICSEPVSYISKIDTEAPTISSVSVSGKVATINKSDTGTSGLASYCVSTSNSSSGCSWTTNTAASVTWTAPSAGTYYAFAKDTAGNISVSKSFSFAASAFCSYTTNQQVFAKTAAGAYEYTVPDGCGGTYTLQVYGAQGGTITNGGFSGGAGGYAYGNVRLNSGDKLTVVVGGQGSSVAYTWSTSNRGGAGGYNGGGTGGNPYNDNFGGGGGGGATHIAKKYGSYSLLSSYGNSTTAANYVLIVAGGGGGSTWSNSGGGCSSTGGQGSAGGGTGGGASFGQGGNGQAGCSNCTSAYGSAGGGGGWSGGSGGTAESWHCSRGGAGGSGYLSSSLISGTTGMQNGQKTGAGAAYITFKSLN